MSVTLCSAALVGLDAVFIAVEADISFGLKAFHIVGLPDRAITEASGRIEAALKNAGLPFPRYRITINLAPAHLKKQGAAYDLPIALALLQAQGACSLRDWEQAVFIGELGLDGSIRPVQGVLSIALEAKRQGRPYLVVPQANAQEAAFVDGITVYGAEHLKQLVSHLDGTQPLDPTAHQAFVPSLTTCLQDLQDVRGQEQAKRALEVAAAGAHNILLSGPPGSGKTLLARSLPGILPAMTAPEALDATRIHSVAGTLPGCSVLEERPFQSPHHTTSGVALVGGGAQPRPGQISLAHRGVLFLDEFPEFSSQALENLRQPLEDGVVTVSRAAGTVTFPARFMLVAAMNPCPCGFASDPFHPCVCTPSQILRYQKKLSGPLLDRIDLHLEVPKIEVEALSGLPAGESSSQVRARIQAARDRQSTRFAGTELITNADMSSRHLQEHCPMKESAQELLSAAAKALHLSARSYVRTIKVARTIADLANQDLLERSHVAEALQFRSRHGQP